jgi:hypothetical protein
MLQDGVSPKRCTLSQVTSIGVPVYSGLWMSITSSWLHRCSIQFGRSDLHDVGAVSARGMGCFLLLLTVLKLCEIEFPSLAKLRKLRRCAPGTLASHRLNETHPAAACSSVLCMPTRSGPTEAQFKRVIGSKTECMLL